jgi:autotransporter translocation and assembly factor TamB
MRSHHLGDPPSKSRQNSRRVARPRRARRLACLVALVALIVAFALRAPLGRAVVAGVLDLATGYGVAFDGLDAGAERTVVRGLRVTRGGDPVLDAERVEVAYDLHGLLPGASPRYGLRSVLLVHPWLRLVRHADGTFNVGGPAARPSGGPGGSSDPPWRFAAHIRGGRVTLLDPRRVLPEARALSLGGLEADVRYDGSARSTYRLTGEVAADPHQRFLAAGRVDASGFAVHRLRAPELDIAPLANYFINTASARVEHGSIRSLDLRAYAFAPRPGGAAAYHFSGSGFLADGAMAVPGLSPPARAMRGRIDLADGGIVAPDLRARLGSLDVRLAGSLYDWGAPALRLGIVAGPTGLDAVRSLFAFSRRLPVTGSARLSALVEGPAGNPLVATRLAAGGVAYDGFPIARVAARTLYYDGAVDVISARGVYGALDVGAAGDFALGDAVHTRLFVDVRGGASQVPYAAQVAPGARIRASGVLEGDGLRLAARGVAAAGGAGTALAGLFHLDPNGDGEFGPFLARRDAGESLAGAYYAHRSASESGFWLDARDYPFALAPADPHLPGLGLAPPAFSGRFSGSVVGAGPPSRFRLVGRLGGRGVRVGDVALDRVAGSVRGAFDDLRLEDLTALGPWGAFAGTGAYADSRLALDGTYRGRFEALRPFTGDLGASGPVAGGVALLVGPGRTVVQARGDATSGAIVRGVPVDGFSGTLAVEGKRLRLYGAVAQVAGATLAAAGSLDPHGGIGVSVAGADGRRMGDLGAVGGPRISAIGSFDTAGAQPRFRGGLLIGQGSVDGLGAAANGDVDLAGSHLAIDATDALVGATLGSFSGSVNGTGSSGAYYDLNLHLADAPLGPFVSLLAPQRRDVTGTLAGDLRVRGTERQYVVSGRVAVPEGAVNGLAFSDASATVRLDPEALRLRHGRITIGTTRAGFGLRFGLGEAAFRIDAPQADLADFNDYFDAGDTLAGRGRIVGRFVQRGNRLQTSGDIAIAALRYRRFDLGDAHAHWTSRGSDATGSISFGGPSGRLAADGTVTLAPHTELSRLFGASRFRGQAHLRELDLGVWLPALGYQFPIQGRVDADANVSGPLVNPVVETEATLAGGSLGRFPVDRLTISATSTARSTTLRRAVLDLPSLSVEGSGSFGLGARDPLKLALHAKSPDLGVFADRLFGANYPVSGSAEADVHVDGTRAKPQVAGGVDLEHVAVRGVSVPQALGQFTVSGRDVVISGVEIGFATGALYLAGSVPIQVAPFSFGPAQAPITLDMTVKGVDLADFSTLLPAGSALAGTLDGRVVADGTAGSPQLSGSLALSAGAVRMPFEVVPLSGLSARLSFEGTGVTLDSFHAASGGGTVDASGAATLPNLVHPGADAAYRLEARAAGLRVDVPALGSGTLDGNLRLSRAHAQPPALAGRVALSDATIPFSALLLASGGTGGGLAAAATAPTLGAPAGLGSDAALDLQLSAERNVRVRSANVDIGARGDLHIEGTRSAPRLTGVFTSTGGTLSYFNTVFRVVDGTVTFQPDLGVIPTLEARASTHVINPDPNTVRNSSGSADITLSVTGPVSNLSIALSSDPSYERQQILGLLLNAPALGAKNLFGDTPGTPTLFGSTETAQLAPGVAASRNASGELSVAQEAFGVANAQFTRTLLAPFETTVASAVGLTNLNVNVDYTGNVGLSARKILGKNVDAIYGTTFGYPYRQTFGFNVKASDATAGQVTVFQTLGASGLSSLTPNTYLYTTNLKLQASQPAAGTAGFSLSLQRLFW